MTSMLRDEVLRGQYRAGERLPSERDLCMRFNVSRGAVREALKQLQQLGIVSIQPGGARVVPIEECTLDVLGPLLDLNDPPDPKLVDEVMHLMGVLMREAATAAIEKANEEDLRDADRIIDAILAAKHDHVRQFEAFRKFGDFYVDLADHLVLRLLANSLRTTFMARLDPHDPVMRLDPDSIGSPVRRIRKALAARDSTELGGAMESLNRLFRDTVREAVKGNAGRSIRRSDR
ncbi:MAG: GntR family transcriptional regulator [Gammaproteobacteria bacterium]